MERLRQCAIHYSAQEVLILSSGCRSSSWWLQHPPATLHSTSHSSSMTRRLLLNDSISVSAQEVLILSSGCRSSSWWLQHPPATLHSTSHSSSMTRRLLLNDSISVSIQSSTRPYIWIQTTLFGR